jgi:hypothetical protein
MVTGTRDIDGLTTAAFPWLAAAPLMKISEQEAAEGKFYTNIAVLGAHASEAADVLRDLGRDAFVLDAGDSCVVFDRECDEQDTSILAALAEHLATQLKTRTFAVLNHDDDVLWFQLYERDNLVAEYANAGGPRTKVGDLCRTLGRGDENLWVWLVLHRPFLFQVSRHKQLARRLQLPKASVGFGYDALARGELPPGVEPEEITRVGRLPPRLL